jgi:deoxyribose-phosphate aldolase
MITNFKLFENKTTSSIIDYTFLKDRTTVDELRKICVDVTENNPFGIVVNSENVGTVKALLEDTSIKIIGTIDFPKGNSNNNFKAKEIDSAMINGADEVDVVFDYSELKELSILKNDEWTKKYDNLVDDIQVLTRLAHSNSVTLKLIIEIEELHFEQIKIACEIGEKAGVDFIQTSTGYSKKNPNWEEKLEKIKYMRRILPNYINIKVAGGIRNQSQIDELITLGVDRIGTSVFL